MELATGTPSSADFKTTGVCQAIDSQIGPILRKVNLMIQSTMRQQILAGILVSVCFLVGALCEQFLQRQTLPTSVPEVMASFEPTAETPGEALQLTNR